MTTIIILCAMILLNMLSGFVKLKKFQKSEKNSEVGGWVKPQLGLLFFLEILCFRVFSVVFMLQKKNKKLDRGVGGWDMAIRVFLGFLDFFQLDKTP